MIKALDVCIAETPPGGRLAGWLLIAASAGSSKRKEAKRERCLEPWLYWCQTLQTRCVSSINCSIRAGKYEVLQSTGVCSLACVFT